LQLGTVWTGEAASEPPAELDRAIVFAPAGELVRPALKKGAVPAPGGVQMSPIPSLDNNLLYQERGRRPGLQAIIGTRYDPKEDAKRRER
jgi:alcohol dehydrogenase, propanol-preferring